MVAFIWLILLFFLCSIVYYSWKLGISPMPSSYRCRKLLLSKLPIELNGKVFELGSGWGGLAIALKKRFPKNPVVALELSLIPYLFSSIMRVFQRKTKVSLKRKDFLLEDLHSASLICCYLYPKVMVQLAEKFQKELLGSGCKVYSVAFALPGKEPVKVYQASDLWCTKIYYYCY